MSALIRSLVALASLLMACTGPPDPEPPTVYVGEAADRDGPLSIAVVVQGDLVAAYACADDPTAERYPGWLTGELLPDGVIELAHWDWSLVASVTADSADGVLREPDGTALAWTAAPATGDDLTGAYAALDAGCLTGVIVLDSAASRVVRGAWCNAEGKVAQVTPFEPMQLVDGRLAVVAELESGPRRLDVAPVELPLARP